MECTSGPSALWNVPEGRVMECTEGARCICPFFTAGRVMECTEGARYGMYRRGALWNVPEGRVMECTKISLLGAAAPRPPLKQMVDIFGGCSIRIVQMAYCEMNLYV